MNDEENIFKGLHIAFALLGNVGFKYKVSAVKFEWFKSLNGLWKVSLKFLHGQKIWISCYRIVFIWLDVSGLKGGK